MGASASEEANRMSVIRWASRGLAFPTHLAGVNVSTNCVNDRQVAALGFGLGRDHDVLRLEQALHHVHDRCLTRRGLLHQGYMYNIREVSGLHLRLHQRYMYALEMLRLAQVFCTKNTVL
jgi:hypothetical protein